MKTLAVLLTTVLLLTRASCAIANPALPAAEQALYSGDFKKALAIVDAGMRRHTDPETRFRFLLQRVRIQQAARLSGLPDKTEASALAELKARAHSMPRELQAQARLAQLVSTYFRRLTNAERGDFVSLQSSFRAVANELTDPCRWADALFFSALMPQMQGRTADSAPGLEQARRIAAAGGCELERSYALRHLAVVAQEAGDLDKAARLADESLAIRRRIKFEVYLPFSLLHSAEISEKRGDRKRAHGYREEALALATRLRLPEQVKAARESLAGEK
jgi:tetratricopeptide (TPR) repeat protein